jgi:hypothetical protein
MADIGGSQSDAFGAGIDHVRNAGRGNDNPITLGEAASTSDQGLSDTSARCNAEAATGFTPRSVLDPLTPSGNGMSAQDAARLLPGGRGSLPSPNGSGQDTYERSAMLRTIYGTG